MTTPRRLRETRIPRVNHQTSPCDSAHHHPDTPDGRWTSPDGARTAPPLSGIPFPSRHIGLQHLSRLQLTNHPPKTDIGANTANTRDTVESIAEEGPTSLKKHLVIQHGKKFVCHWFKPNETHQLWSVAQQESARLIAASTQVPVLPDQPETKARHEGTK